MRFSLNQPSNEHSQTHTHTQTTGKGECRAGVCWCLPGYGKDDCSEIQHCPGNDDDESPCGHGECAYGKCHCYPDWTVDEKEGTCTKKKTCKKCANGSCFDGKCYCSVGWEGDDCDTKTKCENDCNHRGLCDKGECICAPSYTGSDCSLDVERVKEEERLKQCSEGCSGHGICGYNMLDFTTGEPLARCLCESGFAGEFCEVALECKDSCSGRGECVNGHCICSCGYTGEACERVALASDACPKDCFGGGDCIMGQCFCHPGREGALCEKVKACPGNAGDNKVCSGNGVCKYGKCFCRDGFEGDSCEKSTEPASMRFSENVPEPEPPQQQQQEQEEPPQCLNKCNGRGICLEGRCLCDAGFSGQDCGNAEDPRLTSELPALRSSDLVVEENSSSDDEKKDEKKEGSVSTTVATFGSFVAFLVGTAVGTVAMWYKHKRTRARALECLSDDDKRVSLISDAVLDEEEDEEKASLNSSSSGPTLPPMPPIPRN